jgi:hypothetical protein
VDVRFGSRIRADSATRAEVTEKTGTEALTRIV